MNEIRKDYLLNRFVIIAENRRRRPHEYIAKNPEPPLVTACPFCPGNEHMTEKETERLRGGPNGWRARSFKNMYPAVGPKLKKAKGYHEVIVETPKHETDMARLTMSQIADIVYMYNRRIKALEKKKNMKYVLIFKNEGLSAGTSIAHAHSQVIALPCVPPLVQRELDAYKALKKKSGKCPFCEIVKKEGKGPRKIYENDDFIAFTPFAPRAVFEVWIVPKRHWRSLVGLGSPEFSRLAEALKFVLVRLDEIFKSPAYNYYIHIAPKGEDFHFHLELLPRLNYFAGFELGSGAYINPFSPERAARYFRGEEI